MIMNHGLETDPVSHGVIASTCKVRGNLTGEAAIALLHSQWQFLNRDLEMIFIGLLG
jgi:hypothetical protein